MRALPDKISITASYAGVRGRLDIGIPQKSRFIPLNLRGWDELDERRTHFLQRQTSKVEVSVYNRSFAPLT